MPVGLHPTRAVLGKFIRFCGERNIGTRNEVNRQVFDDYASWRDAESYAKATEYLELITLTDESQRRGKNDGGRRTLKSGHSRSFSIHEELKELFAWLEQLERLPDGRVFHGPLGGKVVAQ